MRSFQRGVYLMIKYFLAVVLSLHCACAYAESRPNVLWIYLEDVSGWFGCYGEALIETPNIDALASTGLRFDRFYTPAGVCSVKKQQSFDPEGLPSQARQSRGDDLAATNVAAPVFLILKARPHPGEQSNRRQILRFSQAQET